MSENKLNGLEKAAVLLKSLPASTVEKALRHMDGRQAALIRTELANISKRADLDAITSRVIEEAAEALTTPDNAPAAAKSQPSPQSSAKSGTAAKTAETTPPKPSPKLDLRLTSPPIESEPGEDPLVAIAVVPPELLAQALNTENTRTISLMMNCLDVEIAAAIYKRLTPEKRREVSSRFTEEATVNPELRRRIAQAVLQKIRALQAAVVPGAPDTGPREKRLASLLRGLDRAERTEMLAVLEQSDAELAARVKALLYQFEDILRMQNTSVQKLLTEIDTKTIALSLGGAPIEISDKLFANLSKRAQVSLKEEIDLAGTVPSAKSKPAQQLIAEAIQRLDQRGELLLIE